MDEATAIRLVGQFLLERGFTSTLKALEMESGRKHIPEEDTKRVHLQTILDDYTLRMKQKLALEVSASHLFQLGQGEHADMLLKSFEDVGGGVNILVVRLIENGGRKCSDTMDSNLHSLYLHTLTATANVLIFGAAKSLVGVTQLSLPLTFERPPVTPIFSVNTFCKGAVLTLDVHPINRNLVVGGSMDRLAFILDLSKVDEDMVVQKFECHSKYVVRALWSTSGNFFITASYDKTICVYKLRNDESHLYDNIQKLHFKGVIESLAFCKESDTYVVGVRDDYILHCYSLLSGNALLCRQINMNSFGDDYVSFVPMHISFSPNGQFMLISTDKDRLILYSWTNGKQIASFYGAANDEFSQPRNCWDHSGNYIYGTSQDKCIVVWEVRSQQIVCKLEGHNATVRDLFFCNDLKMLVSCGFDGSIKLWKSQSGRRQITES